MRAAEEKLILNELEPLYLRSKKLICIIQERNFRFLQYEAKN